MNKEPIINLNGKHVNCLYFNIIIENALFIITWNQDGSVSIRVYQNRVSNMKSDRSDYEHLLAFNINRYYASINDVTLPYMILSLYGINDLEEICK